MWYRTTFTVVGTFSFPVDMLRHDGCYPNYSEDASSLEHTFDPHRKRIQTQVQLTKIHQGKDPHITHARWASFSWHVDQASINTQKL